MPRTLPQQHPQQRRTLRQRYNKGGVLELIDHYNTADPSFRFTHTCFQPDINFLEVTMKIDDCQLSEKLHRKPTDGQR